MKPGYLSLTGYRLPTEAEWEYACRAGAVTMYYYGETDELMGKYAWYTNQSQHEVMLLPGSLKPNDLGLFDLCGNAHEWCQDAFFDYPHGRGGEPVLDRESLGDTERIGDRLNRVLRGGSFDDFATWQRSACRFYITPAYSHNGGYGLRPARTFR